MNRSTLVHDVGTLAAPDTSSLPASLSPPSDGFEPKAVTRKRTLTITEFDSIIDPAGPSEAQLDDAFGPLPWMDPITEHLAQYATEEWTIVNRTADAHHRAVSAQSGRLRGEEHDAEPRLPVGGGSQGHAADEPG